MELITENQHKRLNNVTFSIANKIMASFMDRIHAQYQEKTKYLSFYKWVLEKSKKIQNRPRLKYTLNINGTKFAVTLKLVDDLNVGGLEEITSRTILLTFPMVEEDTELEYKIFLQNMEELRKTTCHEVRHAIQDTWKLKSTLIGSHPYRDNEGEYMTIPFWKDALHFLYIFDDNEIDSIFMQSQKRYREDKKKQASPFHYFMMELYSWLKFPLGVKDKFYIPFSPEHPIKPFLIEWLLFYWIPKEKASYNMTNDPEYKEFRKKFKDSEYNVVTAKINLDMLIDKIHSRKISKEQYDEIYNMIARILHNDNWINNERLSEYITKPYFISPIRKEIFRILGIK